MKILQVTAVDFTVKKFLLPLVDELNKNNYETHIACNVQQIGQELSNQGYNLKHIPFTRNLNVFNHLKSLMLLIKLIRKEKYDIIHSHTPVASLITRLAAKLTGTKLNVYTAHGFYFHENMKPMTYKIAYNIEKYFGKYLTHKIFFQSIEDYQLAVEDKFQIIENLVHINNGVSADKFNPELYDRTSIRNLIGIDSSDKVITFIGRMVVEKGVQELINSFEDVHRINSTAVLMIIGGGVQGDRDGLNIEELVNNLSDSAKQRVKIMGLRDDIPQLLAASDIFVLPSYREGLPRSIIEAMAMGKPIIATNIRGCREEVFPGVNGELCNVKDSKSLGEKINEVISDENKMNNYSKQSRNLFLTEFDEKVVLQRQINVFNEFRGKHYENRS